MSWAERVVIRTTSDGSFLRMHPAGFGARFPSGPYLRVDDAFHAPMNQWKALEYKGMAVLEHIGTDMFSYYVPTPPEGYGRDAQPSTPTDVTPA